MDLQKMAALGAQAAAGGIVAAWFGFLYVIRPVPTGGIDHALWQVAAYSTVVLFGLLALVHLYFAAQLKRGADSIRG